MFWRCSLITLCIGWCGMISIIMAPFLLIHNLMSYASYWSMPPVPRSASHVKLDNEIVKLLSPYTDDLLNQLPQVGSMQALAERAAPTLGVTPGQLALYLHSVYSARRSQQRAAR